MRTYLSRGKLRMFALWLCVCMMFAAMSTSALAVVTLETKQYTEPMGEYVGLVGAGLAIVIIAGFAGLALVAFGLSAWKLGKRLIKAVV